MKKYPWKKDSGTGAGFTLVQTIFIIVVLGLLGTFMIRMLGVQSRTTTLSHQGIRAYYAAQSGLEWGKNRTLTDDTCFNSTTFSIARFDVSLNCTSKKFEEGTRSYRWFRLTATSEPVSVAEDSPDYVRRELTWQMVNATD